MPEEVRFFSLSAVQRAELEWWLEQAALRERFAEEANRILRLLEETPPDAQNRTPLALPVNDFFETYGFAAGTPL